METGAVAPPTPQIYYPETAGKPMAESDAHRKCMNDTIETLDDFFRNEANTYVAGNILMYYEEGDPAASVAPDVFVVKGIKKELRRTYKIWVEQAPPTVVFEITSRSTRLEDLGNKRALYALIGVSEYYLFDPLAEYLDPPLQGFQLLKGDYVRMTAEDDGALLSQGLGLRLRPEGRHLRLSHVETGELLLCPAEMATARRAAEAEAQAEAAARRAAEEELERLRAELARLRGA